MTHSYVSSTRTYFECKHDVCLYVGLHGLRYISGGPTGVQKHITMRGFHPCCQNGNLCEEGKLRVKHWIETEPVFAPSLMLPCIHAKCKRSFKFKASYESHILKDHDCIDRYGLDCNQCTKNEEHKKELEKERKLAEKKREKYLELHKVHDEIWREQRETQEDDDEMPDEIIFKEQEEPEVSDSELEPASIPKGEKEKTLPGDKVKILEVSKTHDAVAFDNVEAPLSCKAFCGCYADPFYCGYCKNCLPLKYSETRINKTTLRPTGKALERMSTTEWKPREGKRVLPPELLPTKSIKKKNKKSLPFYVSAGIREKRW